MTKEEMNQKIDAICKARNKEVDEKYDELIANGYVLRLGADPPEIKIIQAKYFKQLRAIIHEYNNEHGIPIPKDFK